MGKSRIMVVDDEVGIRFILRKILGGADYEVIEVASGEECLEALKKEKVDLILMDVMMPRMDGWEATKNIKENPATKGIPVAMLTIRTEEEDKVKSFHQALADAHIEKPIIKEQLLRTIEWLLKNFSKL